MKINIGCGYKKIDDFITIDSDPSCNPDYLLNLETDKLPFEDSSVDKVIAHHILEHLGDGYFHLIKELYRVCKHGAIIDIVVPYHLHAVYFNDPTHKRPITIDGLRMFSKIKNQRDIKDGMSTSTLGIMYDVDFEILKFDFKFDPFYKDIIDSNTDEQNSRLFRECNNVVMETHVIWSTVKE